MTNDFMDELFTMLDQFVLQQGTVNDNELLSLGAWLVVDIDEDIVDTFN